MSRVSGRSLQTRTVELKSARTCPRPSSESPAQVRKKVESFVRKPLSCDRFNGHILISLKFTFTEFNESEYQ